MFPYLYLMSGSKSSMITIHWEKSVGPQQADVLFWHWGTHDKVVHHASFRMIGHRKDYGSVDCTHRRADGPIRPTPRCIQVLSTHWFRRRGDDAPLCTRTPPTRHVIRSYLTRENQVQWELPEGVRHTDYSPMDTLHAPHTYTDNRPLQDQKFCNYWRVTGNDQVTANNLSIT